MSRSHPEFLIHPGWVVPVVPHGVVLEDHAVQVRDGRIVAVAPWAQLRAQQPGLPCVELPQQVLIPGLVNAHGHAAMSLMRGLADDLALMTWLSEHIWPAEARHVGPEFVRDGVELALAEGLRGGTTTIHDMYFFPDVVAATAHAMGVRATVGAIIIDFPSAWAAGPDEYFAKGLALAQQWRGDPLIEVDLAPHAPYTVSDPALERVRLYADELDLRVHMHVHETAFEVEESQRVHGARPLARLDRLGLLNERLSAVHMTQLSDSEIDLIASRGVSVLHCPESNLKLASGFCPVGKLLRHGVNLAIGTDGAASNNDLDMLGETRSAALLAKAVAQDASALDAHAALRAATLGGARALGREAQIGSIEVGKFADLTAITLDDLSTLPVYHPVSQVVYAAARTQVSHVWVAGQPRLLDGQLVDVDTTRLRSKAREWQLRLRA